MSRFVFVATRDNFHNGRYFRKNEELELTTREAPPWFSFVRKVSDNTRDEGRPPLNEGRREGRREDSPQGNRTPPPDLSPLPSSSGTPLGGNEGKEPEGNTGDDGNTPKVD